MQIEIAKQLQQYAKETATAFSDPDREHNPSGEEFKETKLIILSDRVALILFDKSSGKKAFVLAFYRKNTWWGLFPADSHLVGISSPLIEETRREIEQHNLKISLQPPSEPDTTVDADADAGWDKAGGE